MSILHRVIIFLHNVCFMRIKHIIMYVLNIVDRVKNGKLANKITCYAEFIPVEKERELLFSPPFCSSLEFFKNNGYLPWTEGYEQYKWNAIQDVLVTNNFEKCIGTARYGYRIDERIVEYPWFFSRLPSQKGKLLDAGSALNHHSLTLLPALQNKQLYISTLAPEGKAFCDQPVSYVYEDLREPCFRENLFDWICCLSTLEHIGLDNTMLYTSNEVHAECHVDDYCIAIKSLSQCLKTGGHLYITVPFGLCINHKWFQVFDGKMIDSIIAVFKPSSYDETIFQYKNDCWQYSSREQARDELYFDINVQKTYDPDHAAAARAVACLDLIK